MSLAIAVIRETLELSEKTLIFKLVSVQEPLEKSQLKCSAVDAEPPFPHEKIFFFLLTAVKIYSIIFFNSFLFILFKSLFLMPT